MSCLGLICLEGLLAWLLVAPGWIPNWALTGMRSVYVRQDWNVIQGDADLIAYDPEVTYLLRPGVGRFQNREFDTILEANSQGLRDDEASLASPEILVLGDSYAQGWGVQQQESFPQLVEEQLGAKVLNAAMSSFGTARQILLARRFDKSRLRAVVVQYFFNDFGENQAFLSSGDRLEITPQADFEARLLATRRGYRPLAYLRSWLDRSSLHAEVEAATAEEIARACLEVLDSFLELGELPILWMQIDPWADPRYNITQHMERLLRSGEFPDLEGRLKILSLEDVLTPDDFYRLDPHLRARGHDKVAASLVPALEHLISGYSSEKRGARSVGRYGNQRP